MKTTMIKIESLREHEEKIIATSDKLRELWQSDRFGIAEVKEEEQAKLNFYKQDMVEALSGIQGEFEELELITLQEWRQLEKIINDLKWRINEYFR